MKDYEVTFTDGRVGRNRGVGPATFEKVESVEQLVARIDKYVRPFLLSRDVGVVVDDADQRGNVFAGVRKAAEFDYSVTRVHGTGKGVSRADHVHVGDLSPDRPCDWITYGGGKCGKPSPDVQWKARINDAKRWHCPEHAPVAAKIGWLPVKAEPAVPF